MSYFRIITLISIAFIACACSCSESRTIRLSNNLDTKNDIISFKISDSTLVGAIIGVKNIGDLRMGEIVETAVMVSNSLEKPLVVTGIKTTCGCVTVNYDSVPIMPGNAKRFNIEYDSSNRYGFQVSNITLITNYGEYVLRLEVFVKSR